MDDVFLSDTYLQLFTQQTGHKRARKDMRAHRRYIIRYTLQAQ